MRLVKFVIGLLAIGLVSPTIFPVKGEVFGPNVRANNQTANERTHPAIAIGWDGTVYAVWQDKASGSWRIVFAHAPGSGGSFANHVQVATSPPAGSIEMTPDIAYFNETAYVVWQDDRGGQGSNIYFAAIPLPAGIPQPEKRINDEPWPGFRQGPAIAVATNGTLYVAYNNESSQIKLTASYDGGETWTPSSTVSSSLVNTRGEQRVAVDPWGKVYVVWRDGRSGMIFRGGGVPPVEDDDVYIANSTDGGRTFGSDSPVNDVIRGKVQSSPTIAIDGYGRIHVAWKDERLAPNQVTDIFYAHSDDGSQFSKNIPVNDTSIVVWSPNKRTTHQEPSIAVDPLGKYIYISWVDDRTELPGQEPNHNVYVAKSTDGGNTFHPASLKSSGANFFIDDSTTLNGVWDTSEAQILDNGNNILDPGLLDGSPDKVILPGAARLQRDTVGSRLTYHDSNSDGSWQSDEDIVISQGAGGIFSDIRPSALTPWDTTGLLVSVLYFDDSISMSLTTGNTMAVDGFDTASKGLSPTDPVSSAYLRVMYRANSTYTGTATVNWSLQNGANNSWFAPTDTGDVWTNETLDLHALGITTVAELTSMNVSLTNNGAGTVRIDLVNLDVTRGMGGEYDLADTIVYNGTAATVLGDKLTNLTDMDGIAFIDVSMNGTYERGEPLIHQADTMPPFGTLRAVDEVLTRADGAAWDNVFSAFPVNDDPPGSNHYMSRLALNPFDYVNVAWQDWRRGVAPAKEPDIYVSTAPTNGTFGPYMAFWIETAEKRAGPNGNVLYNIWVRNVGGIAADNVVLKNMLPPSLEFVQSSPPPDTITAGTLEWNLGMISSLGFRMLTVLAKMNESVPLNTVVWTRGTLNFADLLLQPRPEMYAALSFVASDMVPPAILHQPPADVPVGSTLWLSVTVTDDSDISDVRLFVKPVGATLFNSPIFMNRVGTTNEYVVSVSVGGAGGTIEYYFEAEDVYGNVGRNPAINAPTIYHRVNVLGGGGGEFPTLAVAAAAVVLLGVILAVILIAVLRRRREALPPEGESQEDESEDNRE